MNEHRRCCKEKTKYSEKNLQWVVAVGINRLTCGIEHPPLSK